MLLIDVTYLVCYLIVPRFTLKKNKNLGTTVNYLFEEDSFQMSAVNAYVNENSTVQYSRLLKIGKNGNDLYLFVSPIQAFVADLSALSVEQVLLLKQLLASKLEPKKIKWKN